MNFVSKGHTRIALASMVILGLVLRTTGLSQRSMTHYDEFYYAHSGLWVILDDSDRVFSQETFENADSPKDRMISGVHPMLPFHSPLLYPTLIGVVYWMLGGIWYSGGAVVSAIAGTASIFVIYVLGCRITGKPLALIAAGCLALSDFHIAYSRMWLTDATFTLLFLASITALIRGLEKQTVANAVFFGVMCGLAWNTKYNGWMPLAVGITTVLLDVTIKCCMAWRRGSAALAGSLRTDNLQRHVIWLIIATVVAVGLFMPWYWYVESHFPGGYASVTGHHRSFSTFAIQVGDEGQSSLTVSELVRRWCHTANQLLMGMPAFRHWGWTLSLAIIGGFCFGACWIKESQARSVVACLVRLENRDQLGKGPQKFQWPALGWKLLSGFCLLVSTARLGGEGTFLILAIVSALYLLLKGSLCDRILVVWLGSFVIAVPFYHAYPRLLLPAVPAAILIVLRCFQIWMGSFIVSGVSSGDKDVHADKTSDSRSYDFTLIRQGTPMVLLVGVLLASLVAGRWDWQELRGVWNSWTPSRSYREFSEAIRKITPRDALIVCRSQPTLWFAFGRDFIGPDDTELILRAPEGRPTYLAVDFHIHSTPRALESARLQKESLVEVARVINDLNPPAMLNLITPQSFWEKMKQLGEREGLKEAQLLSDGVRDEIKHNLEFPSDLNRPNQDWIVLYRVRES